MSNTVTKTLDDAVAEIRAIIINSYGITAINSVNAQVAANRHLSVAANISSIYSSSFAATVTPLQT